MLLERVQKGPPVAVFLYFEVLHEALSTHSRRLAQDFPVLVFVIVVSILDAILVAI